MQNAQAGINQPQGHLMQHTGLMGLKCASLFAVSSTQPAASGIFSPAVIGQDE